MCHVPLSNPHYHRVPQKNLLLLLFIIYSVDKKKTRKTSHEIYLI